MEQSLTILYADDDSEDIDIFREVLVDIDKGIRCVPVINGVQAIQYLETCDSLPDLIFLDINMPLMNGKECLAKIRSDEKFNHVPIIMYSTTTHYEEIKDCYRLGANDFLIKASNFKTLTEDIGSVLKNLQSNIPYKTR